MKQNNKCPDCDCQLKNPTRCTCGWFLVEHEEMTDHRCDFRIGSRRCPLAGTVANHPYRSTVWYCSEHSQYSNDPVASEKALIQAEKCFEEILEQRRDWRTKLFDE